MYIRNYEPEDLESIVRLFQNTIRKVNIHDYSAEQVAAWASQSDVEKWSKRLSNHMVLVAIDDDQIVGFITFEPNGHIDHLYVHAGKQRQGVAALLYLELEDRARKMGIKKLFSEVSITARNFFEHRCGFLVEREQQVQVRGQTLTNFVMSKELQE